MASDSVIQREYRLSDGELALFANAVAIAMRRDILQFNMYGVTVSQIDEMIAMSDNFQAFPNDEILRADLSYAVEQRDAVRNIVLITMRSISVRAKIVFGDNTAKFRSMNTGNISQMSDSNLLIAARQVHSAAESNISALASEGITVGYLTDFIDNVQLFENAIAEIANKRILRDESSEHKVKTGNQLYHLVTKYCNYGKNIFENSSPAKYNDYIIYSSSNGNKSSKTKAPIE